MHWIGSEVSNATGKMYMDFRPKNCRLVPGFYVFIYWFIYFLGPQS